MNRKDVERIIEEDKVSLDDVWKWIGYASKQMARKKLESHLEEGLDYFYKDRVKTRSDGRNLPITDIILSREGFYLLTLSARTEKGYVLRRKLAQLIDDDIDIKNIFYSKNNIDSIINLYVIKLTDCVKVGISVSGLNKIRFYKNVEYGAVIELKNPVQAEKELTKKFTAKKGREYLDTEYDEVLKYIQKNFDIDNIYFYPEDYKV